MAEEIKQLQALLNEFDEDGRTVAMEEGETGVDMSGSVVSPDSKIHKGTSSEAASASSVESNRNRTVKLKYGSLIKTIEASSRAATNSKSTAADSGDTTNNTSFCRNCLRLMFTVFYLIYSKAWVIINTTFIFIVIFICYSIR
jgi:hypothetical protein